MQYFRYLTKEPFYISWYQKSEHYLIKFKEKNIFLRLVKIVISFSDVHALTHGEIPEVVEEKRYVSSERRDY